MINPDETLSLAQYKHLAYQTVETIHRIGGLPFLVGGTGQYFWAVLEGWEVPQVTPDFEFRRSLEERAAEEGGKTLHLELAAINPEAAQRIDPRNVRRVIRALEVSCREGVAISLTQKNEPPWQVLIIGLTEDRTALYRKVDGRVDRMLENGLVKEVEKLRGMGYDFKLPAMSGIGYKQIASYLNNELSLADAIQRIKYETHRYIRQQYTWFRLNDERIKWLNISDINIEERCSELIKLFLNN
jgi:tRNA dimethylallyltransferase